MQPAPALRYKLTMMVRYAIIFEGLAILSHLVQWMGIAPDAAGKVAFPFTPLLWLGFLPGLLVGFADEFFFLRRFRKIRLLPAVLLRTGMYAGFFGLNIWLASFYFDSLGWLRGEQLNYPGGWDLWHNAPARMALFQLLAGLAVQTTVALSVVQINKFVGRGRLLSFITGRYSQPKWEHNLLMFVDLKASTTLSEALNTRKYSEFIRDFFQDIAEAIYRENGRIYQYVGDEVVVYWKVSHNRRENLRPVRCFVGMIDALKRKRQYYFDTYGVMPQFKAGLHGGRLIVTEVGALKKEIAFHGAVVNLASRIQDKCNELNTNFLLSEYVLEHAELVPDYVPFSEGKFILKGSSVPIELFSLEKAENVSKGRRGKLSVQPLR